MMKVKEENGNLVCVFSGRLDTLAGLDTLMPIEFGGITPPALGSADAPR